MSNVVVLEEIELTPVLELVPGTFASDARKSPSGTSSEVPDEWFHYWVDSLADSGITGLRPLRRGSWHVPAANLDDPANLEKFLGVTFREWGGIDALSDPDSTPVLSGGLALRCPASDLIIEPGCCADLGDADNWKVAAGYRMPEWTVLWIGHPWLSVRYQAPWLILSDRHESNIPTTERWGIVPGELDRAVDDAKAEVERFVGELARLLPVLGYRDDPGAMSRRLAGLSG